MIVKHKGYKAVFVIGLLFIMASEVQAQNITENLVSVTRGTAVSRQFNLEADENIQDDIAQIGDSSTGIGTMGGSSGAVLTINGNSSYSVIGGNASGIIVNAGRTLNIDNIGSLDEQGNINAAWQGFKGTLFKANGGTINFIGENVLAQNSAANSDSLLKNDGGVITVLEGGSLNILQNSYASYLLQNTNGVIKNINGRIAANTFNNNVIYNTASEGKESKIEVISGEISNNIISRSENLYGSILRNLANGDAEIAKFTASIIENEINAKAIYGGLVRNEAEKGIAKIGEISGDITKNKITSTDGNFYGALISNKGKNKNAEIDKISSDITENKIELKGKTNEGYGLILNEGNNNGMAKISAITGRISNNELTINNMTAQGGVILNSAKSEKAEIGEISGDITNNILTLKSINGSIISNLNGSGIAKIDTISGNIKENTINVATTLKGGIIDNQAEIATISGNIEKNSITVNKEAEGGIIRNSSQLEIVSGNIKENTVNIASTLNGGIIDNKAAISVISGSIEGNNVTAEGAITGGIIRNLNQIETISGNISGNTIIAKKAISGGIINNQNNVNFISGTIKNNYIESTENKLSSGILYNNRNVGGPLTIMSDIENNYAKSFDNTGLNGGMINNLNITSVMIIMDSTIKNNATTAENIISNKGTLNIIADQKDVLFDNNKAQATITRNDTTGEVSVSGGKDIDINNTNTGGILNLWAKEGKSITFNGEIIDNVNGGTGTTNVGGVYDDNGTERKYSGEVRFNNTVTQKTLNIKNNANIVLGLNGEKYGRLNLINLTNDEENGKINTLNNHIENHKIGKAILNSALNLAIDMKIDSNLTTDADTFDLNSGSSGTFNISNLNIFGAGIAIFKASTVNTELVQKILNNGNANTKLTLADTVKSEYEADIDDEIITGTDSFAGTTITYNQKFGDYEITRKRETRISIVGSAQGLADSIRWALNVTDGEKIYTNQDDNLHLINVATGENRIFDFAGTTSTFEVSEDAGITSAGVLTIKGAKNEDTYATINAKGYKLFDIIATMPTTVEIENTQIDNAAYVAKITDGNTLILDNTYLTATNTSGIENNGQLFLNNNNIINQSITGEGKTTISGITNLNSANLVQNELIVNGKLLNTGDPEIYNIVVNNSGKVSSTAEISGNLQFKLNTNAVFENNGSIEQQLLEIATGATLTNNNQLHVKAQGTNNGTINGSGSFTNDGEFENNGIIAQEVQNNNILTSDASNLQNKIYQRGQLHLTQGTTQAEISGGSSNNTTWIDGNVTVGTTIKENNIRLEENGELNLLKNANIENAYSFVANGGNINLQAQNTTDTFRLGTVNISADSALAIDIDLTGDSAIKKADNLIATAVSGDKKIFINNLNIKSPQDGDEDPEYVKVVDNNLKDYIELGDSTKTRVENIPQNGFMITYAKDLEGENSGGYLNITYTDLVAAARAVTRSRIYVMGTGDENIVDELAEHGGTGISDSEHRFAGVSLTVNGNGTQSVVGGDLPSGGKTGGIQLAGTQTLRLNNIKEWQGFSTAITNYGTVNITNVAFNNNEVDIENNSLLNLYGKDELSIIKGNDGIINISAYEEDNNLISAEVLFNEGGKITQKQLTIDETSQLTNNALLTLTDKILNQGTVTSRADNIQTVNGIENLNLLQLTGGENNNEITGENGRIEFSGTGANKANITQASVTNIGNLTNSGEINSPVDNRGGILTNSNKITSVLMNDGELYNKASGNISQLELIAGDVYNNAKIATGYVKGGSFTNGETAQLTKLEQTAGNATNKGNITHATLTDGILINGENAQIDNLIVNGGETTNSGTVSTITNNNGVVNNEVSGALHNLTNNSAVNNQGTISGEINNQATIDNLGTIVIDSEYHNDSVIKNSGIIKVEKNVALGEIKALNNANTGHLALGKTVDSQVTIDKEIEKQILELNAGVVNLSATGQITENAGLIANGASFNTQNSQIEQISMGEVTLNQDLHINIDTVLAGTTPQADYMSANSLINPSNHAIIIDNIKILSDVTEASLPVEINITNNILKDVFQLSNEKVHIAGIDPAKSYMVTYNKNDEKGFLTFSYGSLSMAIATTAADRQYNMTTDEQNTLLGIEGGENSKLTVDAGNRAIVVNENADTVWQIGNNKEVSINNLGEFTLNQDNTVEQTHDGYTHSKNATGSIKVAGTLNVDNALFNQNQGKIITVENEAQVNINNAVFAQNQSVAITNEGGTLILKDTSFYHNQATAKGAALYNNSTTDILAITRDSVFIGNKVNGSAEDIYNAATINMNAAADREILLTGAVTGNNGIININQGPTNNTGRVEFDNQISSNTLNLYNNAQVKLGYYEQDGSTISHGTLNLNGLKNDASGGKIDSINKHIDNHVIGQLSLKSDIMWAIDANLQEQVADNLTGTLSAHNNGKLLINEINLLADGTYKFIRTKVANENLKGVVGLATDSFIINHLTGDDSYTITYQEQEDGGYLTFDNSSIYNLVTAARETGNVIYTMNQNEDIAADLAIIPDNETKAIGLQKASSYTINGQGYSIDGKNNGGIQLEAGQILTINNVAKFAGFSDTAINNDGVLNINAKTTDILFDSNAAVNNTAELNINTVSGHQVTFATTISDDTTSQGTITIGGEGTVNFEGVVKQNEIMIKSGVVNAAASNFEIKDFVHNKGILNLGFGTLNSVINGDDGITNINGDVSINELVTQKVVNIGNSAVLQTDASKIITQEGINNNGILQWVGTGENDNVILSSDGSGIIEIKGQVKNNQSINQNKIIIHNEGAKLTSDANNLHMASKIENDRTLVLTGGTNQNTIEGDGKLEINTDNKVRNEADILQHHIIISQGELESDVKKLMVTDKIDVTGKLNLTGNGENKNHIIGSGTTEIVGSITTKEQVESNLAISGTLKTSAEKLALADKTLIGKNGWLDLSQNNEADEILSLQNLDLTMGNLSLSIDVDLSSPKADQLKVNEILGNNKLLISNINLINDTKENLPLSTTILSINNSAEAEKLKNNVELSGAPLTINGNKPEYSYLVTYIVKGLTGNLQFEYADLVTAIVLDADQKAYTMVDNEVIAGEKELKGNSLSIVGDGDKTIRGDFSANGIKMEAEQTLSIADVNGMYGFKQAIINDGGTVNLKDVLFESNATDVNNNGVLNLSGNNTLRDGIIGTAGETNIIEGTTTVFATIIQKNITIDGATFNNEAVITAQTLENKKGAYLNNNGQLSVQQLNNAKGAELTSNSENILAKQGIINEGIINLTGGTNKNDITGTNGIINFDGEDNVNQGEISQRGITNNNVLINQGSIAAETVNKGTLSNDENAEISYVINEETGEVENYGTIETIENKGKVSTSGKIKTANNKVKATINNSGEITEADNLGNIDNKGFVSDIYNHIGASMNNVGVVENAGNEGKIENSGQITEVNNMAQAILQNSGNITTAHNTGTINNTGEMASVDNNGEIDNQGHIATIENNQGANLNNAGEIDQLKNQGKVDNSNNIKTVDNEKNGTINNTGEIASVDNQGTLNIREQGTITASLINQTTAVVNNKGLINARIANTGIINNDKEIKTADNSENSGKIIGSGKLTVNGRLENSGNTALISQNQVIIAEDGILTSDNDKIIAHIINNGVYNMKGDENNNLVDGNGTININSSMKLNQPISGTNTLNVNQGTLELAKDQALGNKVTVNMNQSSVLNIENKEINVANLSFGKDTTLKLKINSLTDYGSIVAQTINIEDGATLQATLAQGLIKVGEVGTVQLLTAQNSDFNNFADQFSNNMYQFEKDGMNGAYRILLVRTAEDIARDEHADEDIVNAGHAWVDGGQFITEQSQNIADKLTDLAQSDSKGFIKALKGIVPNAAPIVKTLAIEQSSYLSDMLENHIYNRSKEQQAMGIASGDGMPKVDASVWAKTYAGRSNIEAEGNSDGFNINRQGAVFGLDKKLTSKLLIGVGYGADTTKAKSRNHNDKVQTHSIFAYTQYKPSNWNLEGEIAYSDSQYKETKQSVENIKATYDSSDLFLKASGGYDMMLQNMTITPEVSLRYHYIERDGYQDSAGQKVDGNKMHVITPTLGMHLSTQLSLEENKVFRAATIRPEAYVGIGYDIVSDRDDAFVRLNNGASYTLHGNQLDPFFVETRAGAKTSFTDDVDVGLWYLGNYRGDYQSHAGMVELKVRF